MQASDWSLVISALAFLFSIYNFIKNVSISNQNMKLSMGQQEIAIRQSISLERDRLGNRAAELVKNSSDSVLYQNFLAAEENLRNAYEVACTAYLEKKMDQESFERSYKVEIRQLVEDVNQKKHYDSFSSKYKSTKQVYEKWN